MTGWPAHRAPGQQVTRGDVRLVVFGSANLDTVLHVSNLPQWGHTALVDSSARVSGGKGANQAVAAARLGSPTWLFARVGDDEAGSVLARSLNDSSVRVRLTGDGSRPTGSAVVFVRKDGANAILVSPGANESADPADLLTLPDDVEVPTVLLLQLELPLATVARAMQIGHARGWHVVLNAAPADPGAETMMSAVDTVIVNEHEATLLAGVKVLDAETAQRAAIRLRTFGPARAVVTLGALGAVSSCGDQCWWATPPPVAVIDTTAAGDAFVGAFATAMLHAWSDRSALAFAVAAGALATTAAGAQPALPGLAAVTCAQAKATIRELTPRSVR